MKATAGKLLIKKAEDGTVKDFAIWVPEPEEKKPKIMVRILDVRRMLMSLRLNYLTGVCFYRDRSPDRRKQPLPGADRYRIFRYHANGRKPENSEGNFTDPGTDGSDIPA